MQLWQSLLMMMGVAVFGMGWQPWCCCGNPCNDAGCTVCGPVPGKGPESFELVVTGFVDEQCPACEDYNGTYLVDWDSACTWIYDTSTEWAGLDYNDSSVGCTHSTIFPSTRQIRLQVRDNSSPDRTAVILWVATDRGDERHEFESAELDHPDCCAYVDEPLSYARRSKSALGVLFGCNGTGASITATSVPAV